MKNTKVLLAVVMGITMLLVFFLLPVKQVFLFTEVQSKSHPIFYVKMNEEQEFQIRYVHSIHLTDVIESYKVTKESKIRLLSMAYESLSIGLPGEAAEGETLELKDGVYTLTYNDKVIDSFVMRIGNVDADLAFRYEGNEIDLKEYLKKSKSYEFKVAKVTFYQLVGGVNLYDKG